MAQSKLFHINPTFSILLFLSLLGLSNLAFAELTLRDCAARGAKQYEGLYRSILNKATHGPMKWCPLWAAVCGHIHRNCPSVATCQFTNYDSRITTPYDPSSLSADNDFGFCMSCSVESSINPRLLFQYGVLVPTFPYPAEESKDIVGENLAASSVIAAITALLIVSGIAGSVVTVKTTVANPETGGGTTQSTIDAITLLLHFQSISTSGLLSLSYPTLYRFFSYNFAWANLIIAPDVFKRVVRSIGADPSCLSDLGFITDPYSVTGLTVLGARYDLNRAMVGGLVYLTAIIGVAVALALSVLISVILHTLNAIYKSGKFQAQVEIWPLRASSMTLRLFLWVLGSITTFTMYQFVEPCSSVFLIALASVEFALIILTLFIVTILIVVTANTYGHEALYTNQLVPQEESIYVRKWGSLYGLLKPASYWFFIPDYIWILVKGIIVGFGQGSGLAQVCALIGVELTILLALLSKRPYSTLSSNAFHMFSACKRLVASASLLVFWGAFGVPIDIKRVIGIILISVESTYAVVLFIILLLNSGARIVKWNAERKEQRRTSVTTEMTGTTVSVMGPPPMHHVDSYFSNASPMQEKPVLIEGNK